MISMVVGLVALFQASVSFAYDSRFEINPDLAGQLDQLAQNHTTTTSSGRSGNQYWVDASAVLKVDAAKLLAASLDYDHYVQFGMPHLNDSRVVETASPDLFYTYASMSYITMSSRHYLEIRVHRTINDRGGAGLEWELTPKRASWPYNESSSFTRLEGSFFIQPLADGNVYVRSYLTNDVNVPLGSLLSGIIQKALRNGAADVIMALARQAPVQP
jgi:hypothetical protein